MKKTKMEKGITLIALIITIVVLLILAVVTIGTVKDSGIIGYAQKAADDYNKAKADEKAALDSYLAELEKNNASSSTTENSLLAMYKAGTLKFGDYVDYNPTKNDDNSEKIYKPDGDTIGSLTGYTEGTLQTVTQEDLNWRVLGYDSVNDKLLLISGAPTTEGIHIYGHIGYNNYEDVINNACSNLYSNSSLGVTARSINMNDIDEYLGGSAYNKTETWGGSTIPGGYGYNNPNLSSYVGLDSTTGRLTKLENPVTLNLTSSTYFYAAADLIKDATKLEILCGKNKTCSYYNFVASRSVYVKSDSAQWCHGFVDDGYIGNSGNISLSNGVEYGNLLCLRPVVSLGTNVTTTDAPILETAPTESWNDPFGFYSE